MTLLDEIIAFVKTNRKYGATLAMDDVLDCTVASGSFSETQLGLLKSFYEHKFQNVLSQKGSYFVEEGVYTAVENISYGLKRLVSNLGINKPEDVIAHREDFNLELSDLTAEECMQDFEIPIEIYGPYVLLKYGICRPEHKPEMVKLMVGTEASKSIFAEPKKNLAASVAKFNPD